MTFETFTIAAKYRDEAETLDALVEAADLSKTDRDAISEHAAQLVRDVRRASSPTLMEGFLTEYSLSSQEGVALMCLAEAMLRVPDNETIDALIEDKIAPSDWGQHLGSAASSLVNASTWALMLTGKVLDDDHDGISGVIRGVIKRLGEPLVRVAVAQAMKEMGRQYVLGEDIFDALKNARALEDQGYLYSYDMLGEAAVSQSDADRYAASYSGAIAALAKVSKGQDVRCNPGISIKLSALHPRYEVSQEARVLDELVPVVLDLAKQAKAGGMGLNIDAEEQDRLVLSLKVIEAVMASPDLEGWDGFGVVVQAYGKRAELVIDWLYQTAIRFDRKVMVRLVKGAYWDTEMKHAQVEGLPGFTLFTTKAATDVSYVALAQKLFGFSDRIYPQFATHNAHTVAAVLHLARGRDFEFQRLHGMGESLHDLVLREHGVPCRIYAPVGKHRDLLAYLVRRLLENGANSSFVHQIVNDDVDPEEIALDPFEALSKATPPKGLVAPDRIFGARQNSRGFDLADDETLAKLQQGKPKPEGAFEPRTVSPPSGTAVPVLNPFTGNPIAEVIEADPATVARALKDAATWQAPAAERASVLRQAADLYESHFGKFFDILAREAGKTLNDCVGELREAVDFLRYYADEAERNPAEPRGVFTAISPWNFPLAIFTGQVAAGLATGNAVLAKPAETTPIVACLAVDLLHQAGVPRSALQLLPGQGSSVGAALTSDPRLSGVVFTGSTATAKRIQNVMAETLAPGTPLIAETGGLNAMIVDSTALLEKAVLDVVQSAFQSAGQRCSALRCLYVQEDVADDFATLLKGAMDELVIGDPRDPRTDVGPVIDDRAYAEISAYVDAARSAGRLLYSVNVPGPRFVPPALIEVDGIHDLEREVFGPVLHIATFESGDLGKIVGDINASGFGLTFGLHTRIDGRVQDLCDRLKVGNIYVNRNQIGAIVGSQPFGGEGLSGTGPKAGGPHYLMRFAHTPDATTDASWTKTADPKELQSWIDGCGPAQKLSSVQLPGPTGEDNTLTTVTRAPLLCLGPGEEAARQQRQLVLELGGIAVQSDGHLAPDVVAKISSVGGVLYWGADGRDYAAALARRPGPIVPLIVSKPDLAHVIHERHICVDTTASGGNAALLAG